MYMYMTVVSYWTRPRGDVPQNETIAPMVRSLATRAAFDSVLAGEQLVCVDFTAAWCGPCQEIAPAFKSLAKEFPHVTFCKVDVDENEDTAEACQVTAMPTFQFFLGGQRVRQVQGADLKKLRKVLTSVAAATPPASVPAKKQKRGDTSELERAEMAAAALLKAKEERASKAAGRALGGVTEGQTADEGDGDVRSSEKDLVAACKAAKEASKSAPTDAKLAEAYREAKEAYREFRASQTVVKSKQGRDAGVVADDCESWTCELCNVTLSIRADGRAKTQHLEGKAHLKQARRQAASAALSTAPAGDEAASAPAAPSKAFFVCRLCACTLATSAEATHLAGANHTAKVRALEQIVSSGKMQKGDWLCVQHGAMLQHNFASKARCQRSSCDGTREGGVSYEEALKLVPHVAAKMEERKAGKKGKGSDGGKTGKEGPAGVREAGGETSGGHSGAGKGAAASSTSGGRALATTGATDVKLSCRDCKAAFTFTGSEQRLYEERGYTQPVRCIGCRSNKRKRAAEAAN